MRCLWGIILTILDLGIAEAVQEHTGKEGLVVHELSHIFLLISSLLLAITILKSRPPKATPLKNLAMTGVYMGIWSLTTFVVHLLRPEDLSKVLILDSPSKVIWYIGSGLEHILLFIGMWYFLKVALSIKRFTMKKDASASFEDN